MHRLALVLLIAGCGNDVELPDQQPDGDRLLDALPASGACAEATQHSDFAWIQDNVFTPSCTGRACHHANDDGWLSLAEGDDLAFLSPVAGG